MVQPPEQDLSLEEMDRHSLFHPVTSIADHLSKDPLIIERGSGVTLTDTNGKQYIDAFGGLWCVNVGYGRERLADAAAAEMRRVGYSHMFNSSSNEPQIRLADRLLRLLHTEAGATQMSKIFFGLSGSDANDTQVKLVRYYNNLRGKPEKKKIISRWGAYHGLTVVAASLTGIPMYHEAFDLPVDGILHTSTPHYYRYAEPGETEEQFSARLAEELEQMIRRQGPETIAAFIAEPIMGAGGVIVPPSGYFDRIQPILEKNDILFIVDEVICGFGRLGSWFGTSFYGLRPDLMSFAKGLTSAYFPLSAVAVSEKVWRVLEDASGEVGIFAHGFTYSGHPVGGAVGLANLDILESEDLVGQAARVGAYLKRGLIDRLGDHPHVGEIRGEGLMIAVELVADRHSKAPLDSALQANKKISNHALEAGLMVRSLAFGDVVAFAPSLTFTESDAERIIEIFANSVEQVMAGLPEVGVRAG